MHMPRGARGREVERGKNHVSMALIRALSYSDNR